MFVACSGHLEYSHRWAAARVELGELFKKLTLRIRLVEGKDELPLLAGWLVVRVWGRRKAV